MANNQLLFQFPAGLVRKRRGNFELIVDMAFLTLQFASVNRFVSMGWP